MPQGIKGISWLGHIGCAAPWQVMGTQHPWEPPAPIRAPSTVLRDRAGGSTAGCRFLHGVLQVCTVRACRRQQALVCWGGVFAGRWVPFLLKNQLTAMLWS